MNKRVLYALPLVLALAAPLLTGIHVASADSKVVVLESGTLRDLAVYMYNSSSGGLLPLDSGKVNVSDSGIVDLVAGDNIVPIVVMNLSAPSYDANTNETSTDAYIVSKIYSDELVVGVADIVDNTVNDIRMIKISPVSGDIAIVRTSSDVIVYANGVKFELSTANLTDPHVLLMTKDGGSLLAASVQHVALRAIPNPPSGYTLIRSGSGPAVFTISANGPLSIWFDESHDHGDADLFIFDSTNPHFGEADASKNWFWLYIYSDTMIFADYGAETATITANNQVKFVVQMFNRTAVNEWKVAVRLSGNDSPQPEPEPTQPTTTSNNQHVDEGALASLRNAYESNPGLFIIAVLLFLAFIVLLLRR